MTVEKEIVEWAATRHTWQRVVMKRAARGEYINDAMLAELVPKILEDETFEDGALALEDVPGATTTGDAAVALLAIEHPQHVNALVDSPGLTFAPSGLTVVYGDNGSGKSGYARLVKSMVRARHQEPVLTDVFSDRGGEPQAAQLTVSIGGASRSVSWPADECPELSNISFYDEACGDAYVSKESDVRYRPSSLFLLDRLIQACDAIRAELDRRLEENRRAAKPMPNLPAGTRAADFLSSLSAATTAQSVELACTAPPNAAIEIERLTKEEARLRATAPAEEKRRLNGHARKFRQIAEHVGHLEARLGTAAVDKLGRLHSDLQAKRTAAEEARRRPKVAEPLGDVGSSAWKTLWEAARAFAEAEAYRGRSFPFVGAGARCVLCQQELDTEGVARLKRFDEFVAAKTQQELRTATSAWSNATSSMQALSVAPSDIKSVLEDLEDDYSDVVEVTRDFLGACDARLLEVVGCFEQSTWSNPATTMPADLSTSLSDVAQNLAERAEAISDTSVSDDIERARAARVELEASSQLSLAKADVHAEIARLASEAQLSAARSQTNTTGISMKSTELARKYVTRLVRDRFTRESDRLLLERVTLDDLGSPKGKLHHRPAFVGAVQQVAMPRVLSEGEQTALGLAGFFTEAFFDASRSSIVLDDPVSSLDHVRRGHVASRLAEFASSRQVVVFTHDISFVNDLRLAAERENVAFTGRGIERRVSGEPGVCCDTHPWKVKDVKQRLGELQEFLSRIKKEKSGWDQQSYERETSEWAGKLSETWERMLNQEVVGQVVDRGTLEVRPKSFRILAKITEDDDREFQASYARCSRWARRHDKSGEVNYVPPTDKELEQELALVRAWFDRVKKYRD
jgi:energy-coupling factor transporter ATP-binding protein EcfA2